MKLYFTFQYSSYCNFTIHSNIIAIALKDFNLAIDWLLNTEHPYQHLEEAILGAISSIDKSESPAGRAKRIFHAELHGRTLEYRQQMREKILATSLADLKRVGEKYLANQKPNTVIITDFSNREKAQALGLDVREI